MNRLLRYLYHFTALFSFLMTLSFSQNLAMYMTLMEEGKIQSVREKIPELKENYPGEPGVHYLDAATTLHGDSAYKKYLNFIEKYPNSRYTDDSMIKVGEYLYSRGLYTQASRKLKLFAGDYPESEHVQRALNLMVRSFQATGELDSARYYVDQALFAVPGLNTSAYDLPERKPKLVKLTEKDADARRAGHASPGKAVVKGSDATDKPWVVQVGAFSKYNNARRLVTQLRQGGYVVVQEEIQSGGRRLHAVRVVRYSSRAKAVKVGQELKKRFGLDYRVINSPEKN